MITKLTGIVTQVGLDAISLEVGPLEYEVRVPDTTRRQLQSAVGQSTSLFTLEYFEGNPAQGRLVPRLIGFSNPIDREFFELFCSVDGVGVKKALRAMVQPVRDVARAIEEQDAKFLASLPGVGAALAERVIAKLRRKVSKFALLVARETELAAEVTRDVVEESFDALRSLGHSEADARRLLDGVLKAKRKFASVEDVLQAVYEKSRGE